VLLDKEAVAARAREPGAGVAEAAAVAAVTAVTAVRVAARASLCLFSMLLLQCSSLSLLLTSLGMAVAVRSGRWDRQKSAAVVMVLALLEFGAVMAATAD
jgi:hypothetical protein